MNPEIEQRLESIGERLGRIEAMLKRFLDQPSWIGNVAIPDEDVGYVFMRLAAGLVKLPVDISVGDDTPLVIACPNNLDVETRAAIRRWVVRHRDVLDDHWHGRISSDELIQQLKEDEGDA